MKEFLKRALPALGVMASLLLVAYEVRQNTKATRGMTLQGIADQSLQIVLAGFNSPEFRLAYQRSSRGPDYATPGDHDLLLWWYSGVMRVMENRYRQVELGLVNKQTLAQLGGASGAYRHPYFREYWENQRATFPPDFVEWVEANLLTMTVDSLPLGAGLLLPQTRASWAQMDSLQSATTASTSR